MYSCLTVNNCIKSSRVLDAKFVWILQKSGRSTVFDSSLNRMQDCSIGLPFWSHLLTYCRNTGSGPFSFMFAEDEQRLFVLFFKTLVFMQFPQREDTMYKIII